MVRNLLNRLPYDDGYDYEKDFETYSLCQKRAFINNSEWEDIYGEIIIRSI